MRVSAIETLQYGTDTYPGVERNPGVLFWRCAADEGGAKGILDGGELVWMAETWVPQRSSDNAKKPSAFPELSLKLFAVSSFGLSSRTTTTKIPPPPKNALRRNKSVYSSTSHRTMHLRLNHI